MAMGDRGRPARPPDRTALPTRQPNGIKVVINDRLSLEHIYHLHQVGWGHEKQACDN